MADDQVKYSDLISDDVAVGIGMLDKALKELKETMVTLKTEAVSLGKVIKNSGTATKEQQQTTAKDAAEIERLSKEVKNLTDKIKMLEEVKLHYRKLTNDQITSLKAFQQALRGSTAEQLAAVNAIEVEKKSYNELNAMYNTLKDSLNAMTVAERENSDAGKAMTVQAKNIRNTMNELQKSTGNYTLQVGKYRSAFDGLGYSFQQILREAPSAINLNQFFLAISNNIPMFVDQLKAFKDEQKAIKENLATMTKGTAEYAEQLGKVESVGRKLGKALVSWQSLVLVGLIILRNFDRIVSGISGLFNKVTKEQQRLNTVNEEAASTVGDLTAKYRAMQKEWKELKTEDQDEWLEKHKSDWQELGYSIDDAKKAEDFYVNNTSAVQQAIDARARSMASMKLAAEKYEEMFKLQVKADKAFTTMREMEDAGTAYEYRKERSRYIGNAASGSVTTIVIPAGKYKTGAYARAGLEYDMYKRQAESLRKEAEEFMKFVQSGTAGGGSGSENESDSPVQEASNLLTLTRELEDQIIENIENEFQRATQAEIKRHERFVEDKQEELKLAEGDAEKQAVINKQIEEDGRTHQRKMNEIDMERHAYLTELTNQRLEQEAKAAEEAEKTAVQNAKNLYKKLANEWEQERTSLVEQGAKQRELIQAEIEAEINRLNTMLNETQRNAEGIIMTDEEQQKIKEWINLLNQLAKSGNFELINPGQIFGKGADNLGKKQEGNYTSIIDLLFPELDSNQQSALNSVFDQAKQALNSWMDARQQAADQAKQLADDEVSAAENALTREIELRNQGFANDVAMKERELAKAKEIQKKAAEEQKKAAQEQIMLDAATQTSSLITASANIIKQFPNPVLWIPMLTLMWSSFATAKIKAYQASERTLYRKGGYMLLEGGSHDSGNDINLGIGPDGSNLRAEGGEYFAVINKSNSRKYGSVIPDLVNSLNNGTFEQRFIRTADAIGNTQTLLMAGNNATVDLSEVEHGVYQLVKQGENSTSTEGNYQVTRYKNRIRKTLNR